MGKGVKTIADIAKIAGVSKSTVSRALSGSKEISEKTTKKIRKIADEHNFCFDNRAQCLSRGETRIIGCLCDFACMDEEENKIDFFQSEMINALALTLGREGYDPLLLFDYNNDPSWPYSYYLGKKVDGFIILAPYHNNRVLLERLLEIEAPFAAWSTPIDGLSYPTAGTDDFKGAYEAVTSLIKMGRRKIAFIGLESQWIEFEQRHQGYLKAHEDAGLPTDKRLQIHTGFNYRGGRSAMEQLLKAEADIDAVFVVTDLMALGAVEALRLADIAVPEKIAVVGFDDIVLSRSALIPLSTMSQDITGLSVKLAHNLIEYLNNGTIINTIEIPQLIKRSTT